MKKLVFALFIGFNACGQQEQVAVKANTVDVIIIQAPVEITDEVYANQATNSHQWLIDAAIEVSGTTHPDNVDCETLPETVQVLACTYSNDSFLRVLGYNTFTSDVSIVFIPHENWDAFLTAIGFDLELYGKPGALCASDSYEETKPVMFLPFKEGSSQSLTEALNHERVHCTLGAANDEVMSQFMQYVLTADQANNVGNATWAEIVKSNYEYFSQDYPLHAEGKMIVGNYFRQVTDSEGSYESHLTNTQAKLMEMVNKDWSFDELPTQDEALIEYVVDFVDTYFKHQKDAGVYP